MKLKNIKNPLKKSTKSKKILKKSIEKIYSRYVKS